jgi:hypothetical protein
MSKPTVVAQTTVWLALAAAAMLLFMPTNACAQGTAAQPAEAVLSPAENSAIDQQIAALHSAADRALAREWTNARKVAEVLCRPAATAVLRKQIPGTDRFFLGTDDPKTLTLESSEKLSGTGTARTPKGWQDFTFTCKLDSATAKVTSFTPVSTPATK